MKEKGTLSIITAERLKKLREEKGLSHAKLKMALEETYKIEISESQLKNYEITYRNHKKFGANLGMNSEYARCFSDFYGVSTDYIFGVESEEKLDLSKLERVGMPTNLFFIFQNLTHNLGIDYAKRVGHIFGEICGSGILNEIEYYIAAKKAEREYSTIYNTQLQEYFKEHPGGGTYNPKIIHSATMDEIRQRIEKKEYVEYEARLLLSHCELQKIDSHYSIHDIYRKRIDEVITKTLDKLCSEIASKK